MAFWGHKFLFNGIPCETFDLMMYDIGENTQGEGTFAHTVTVHDEVVGKRWRPYYYGSTYANKQTFTIVFGVNQERIDSGRYLDRYELDAVASWLAGHDKYLWLEIEQDDMEYVRYRCMITALSTVSYGNIPWALNATVTCDSPYAYLYPQSYKYDVNGSLEFSFYNESSHNGFYYPKTDIVISSGSDFSITNLSDDGRTFSLSGLPAVRDIYVDHDAGVITTDGELNLYPYFNFVFLRLKRGYNSLRVDGNGSLTIRCEFPINPGG